jgi:hypothetical protein
MRSRILPKKEHADRDPKQAPSRNTLHDVEKISLDLSHGPATKILAVT